MVAPSRQSARRARGFTLAEMLVAIVMLGILGAALTRLLANQSRYYDHEANLRKARTIALGSMNIMLSDMRMVQAEDGVDSASADGKVLRLLVPYRFGLVCGTNLLITTVTMLPIDSAGGAMSTYAGFAWRGANGHYTYVTPANPLGTDAPVASGTPALCTGSAAGQAQLRTVSMNGRTGQLLDLPANAATGAIAASPVFFWQKITYAFAASNAYPGKIGLWRNVQGRANEEIMAPFDASARFKYYSSTSNSVSSTTVPALTNIRGVDIVLNAVSPRTTSNSTTPSHANITTSVFFKNQRAF